MKQENREVAKYLEKDYAKRKDFLYEQERLLGQRETPPPTNYLL